MTGITITSAHSSLCEFYENIANSLMTSKAHLIYAILSFVKDCILTAFTGEDSPRRRQLR